MDYIEKIVLNWILYSSNEGYTYKTKCKIIKYVKENLDKVIDIVTFLYNNEKNSKAIIISARGNKFINDMDNLYMKAINYKSKCNIDLDYKFFSEVCNRYKDNKGLNNSYLEKLLLDYFGKYYKDNDKYKEICNIVSLRASDVIEAMFICNLKGILVVEFISNDINKEIDKLLVIARNLKLMYNTKYEVLHNDFMVNFEEMVHGKCINESKYDDDKNLVEWLYGENSAQGNQNILLNWCHSVCSFAKDSEEMMIVEDYIINDYDKFLEALMAMYVLGVNIENSIDLALRGDNYEFEDLINKYYLNGLNMKIYFKDSYNKDKFIKMINKTIKRERRK